MNIRRLPDKIGRERIWKQVSYLSGLLSALLAKKLMRAGYRAIRKDSAPTTPFDPTDARFSWPDAVLWAAAAGIGLGIAQVVSTRIVAIGWKVATEGAFPGYTFIDTGAEGGPYVAIGPRQTAEDETSR